MKIHPLFLDVISQTTLGGAYLRKADGTEKSRQAIYMDWVDAGSPVVEEEPKYEAPSWPFWMGSTVRNLTGNINMDAYPELRRAIVEAVKREDDLVTANARIKELEAAYFEARRDARDAALEEAAKEALASTTSYPDLPSIADRIRKLKK